MFGRFRRVRVSPAECGIVPALDGDLFHHEGLKGPQRMHEGCERAPQEIRFIVSAPTDNDFVHSSWSLVSFVLKNAPDISTNPSGPHRSRPGWEKRPGHRLGRLGLRFNRKVAARSSEAPGQPERNSGAGSDGRRPSLGRHVPCAGRGSQPAARETVERPVNSPPRRRTTALPRHPRPPHRIGREQ